MVEPKVVACPTCSCSVKWIPENRYRPFCSERCKLADLGAWATERYRIPAREDEDEDGNPDPGRDAG